MGISNRRFFTVLQPPSTYVAAGHLEVLDVSDPSNPQQVGTYFTSGHAQGVAVSGNYAYLADGDLQIIDVRDPSNPRRVGGYATGGNILAVGVSAHYAYIMDGNGLQVLDVSDPADPKRVGGNTGFSGEGISVSPSHVFVSGGQGLIILHQFTPLSGPPLWLGPVRAGGGGMELSVQGLPGLRVEIERSSDLQHWQSWASGLLGTAPLELASPEASPQQFYRAKAR